MYSSNILCYNSVAVASLLPIAPPHQGTSDILSPSFYFIKIWIKRKLKLIGYISGNYKIKKQKIKNKN